jgi:hypothetical protein
MRPPASGPTHESLTRSTTSLMFLAIIPKRTRPGLSAIEDWTFKAMARLLASGTRFDALAPTAILKPDYLQLLVTHEKDLFLGSNS